MSFQTDLYDRILEDVITLTKRPDLEEETAVALRTATLNSHHHAFYPRDRVETLVQLPNASYQTSLDIQNLFPRFRAVAAVTPVDVNYAAVTPSPSTNINIVELDDVYDPVYRTLKNNIAYVGGTTLNIRSAYNSYGFIVGWFQSPLTRREEYNSWIAQLYDPIIIHWAAALVMYTNGNEEKANKYMKMVETQFTPYMERNYLLGRAS